VVFIRRKHAVYRKKKVFIFELKENRLAADSESKRDQGAFERLELLKISEEKPVKVWIWKNTQKLAFA